MDREPASGLTARFAAQVGRLAPKAPALLIAVSGGGDSVAALKLALSTGLPVCAAHFDHGLRKESPEDARFVAALCQQLRVTLIKGAGDVAAAAKRRGYNLPDAARRLRYAFLHRALKELPAGSALVVAHTLEDQAETILMQLLRGAAFPTGMSARRGAVIRPLLTSSRGELRSYLRRANLSWLEDPSNLDTRQLRPWVRHELLPRLEERSPGVTARLAGTGATQRSARRSLEQIAKLRFPRESVRLTAYARAPVAVRKAALAERLSGAGSAVSAELLERIDTAALKAAEGGPGTPPARLSLPRGARLEAAYGELRIARAKREGGEPLKVTRPEDLPTGVNPGLLQLEPELLLRRRAPGDRIELPGGSKLVSDLLIDLKVPSLERDELYVLAAGGDRSESGDVFWVEGVAVARGAAAQGGPLLRRDHARFMRAALREARRAATAGEVPVGAVVVSEAGELLAAAHNRTEELRDPTAHAELLALRAAAAKVGDWRLSNATLYVTLEPCPMCLGAALQTHLKRIVYGADNLREGALGSVTDLTGHGFKRTPEVLGGVHAKAATELLRRAFGRGE